MNSPILHIHLKHKLTHLLHQNTNHFSHKTLLQIHSQLITQGFHLDQSCLLPLLNLCASNPDTLDYGTLIFHQIEQPNIALWQIMIRRHASSLNPSQSICLYRDMQRMRRRNAIVVDGDPFIFASVIKACGKLNAVRGGESVHCQALKLGLDDNTIVGNSLIHFYSNAVNSIYSSWNLFDEMPHRNIATLNSMISGFVRHELFEEGLCLFIRVLSGSFDLGVKPNDVTLVVLISGCTRFGSLVTGRTLHGICCKTMLDSNVEVSNALMNMYSKFGCVDEAFRVFNELPETERDLISWNTMIAAYAENSYVGEAIQLFNEIMRTAGLEGDNATFVNLVSACAQSKDLDMGKAVHAILKIRGIRTNGSLGTSLITMYSKLGLIEFARKVFDELQDKNIISWNSMITGYVEYGCFSDGLKLFHLLQMENLSPDEVTMLELISACRNLGDLNHGRRIHSYIVSYGFDGNKILSNALIDMYAKCGSMIRATTVFNNMLQRDVITWTSIIVGHAINSEGKEALAAFNQMCQACLIEDGKKLYQEMCSFYRIEPKIEHCGCIVDMLARGGLLEEAHEFVKRMPFEPNTVMWRMLLGGCRVHGDFDLGLSLVGGIIESTTTQTSEDYVISSNIYAEAGKWEEASLTRRFMAEEEVLKYPGQSLIHS